MFGRARRGTRTVRRIDEARQRCGVLRATEHRWRADRLRESRPCIISYADRERHRGVRVSRSPVVLCILDGFGVSKEQRGNAIAHADMPRYRALAKTYPTTELGAAQEAVGL